jgi:predicted nucleic acid-binding protein
MPDRVICDTSPLFYLHRLRHLALLQKLYRRILVPEAVSTELLAGRDQGEDVPALTQYDWIEVHRVRTQSGS